MSCVDSETCLVTGNDASVVPTVGCSLGWGHHSKYAREEPLVQPFHPFAEKHEVVMSTQGCSRCGSSFLGPTMTEAQTGLCERCLTTSRAQPATESTQTLDRGSPISPCARCGHPVLVKFTPRYLVRVHAESAYGLEDRSVSVGFSKIRSFLEPTLQPNPSGSVADLEAMFCRACGLVVWFVRNPQSVPIDVRYGTELVEAPHDNPYR